MAIAFGGVAAMQEDSTGSDTAVLPSGYGTGDLLICHMVTKSQTDTDHAVSGWTQIGTVRFIDDPGPSGTAASTWYKFAASAAETAPTVSCTSPSVMIHTCLYFTSDADSLVVIASGTRAQTAEHAGTAATGLTAGSMLATFVATGDNNNVGLKSGSEQGFTLSHGGSSYHTTLGFDAAMAGAYKLHSAGTTQTFPTFIQNESSPDVWTYIELEIKEAAGGTSHTGSGSAAIAVAASGSGSVPVLEFFEDFEGGTVPSGYEDTGPVSVTVATDQSNTGAYSLKVDLGSNDQYNDIQPGNFQFTRAAVTTPFSMGVAFRVENMSSMQDLCPLMIGADGSSTGDHHFGVFIEPSTGTLYVQGSATQTTLRTGSADVTFYTSAAGAIVEGVWYYVELEARVSATAGSLTCHLDGVEIYAGTGLDTDMASAGSPTTTWGWGWYFDTLSATSNIWLDDVYAGENIGLLGPPTGGRIILGSGAASVAVSTSATGSTAGDKSGSGAATVTVATSATGSSSGANQSGSGAAAVAVAAYATGTATRFGSGSVGITVSTSASIAWTITGVADGAESKFNGSTIPLATFTPPSDGVAVVMLTTVMNDDQLGVPVTDVNTETSIGWAGKNGFTDSSRRVDAFAVPVTGGVSVDLDATWAVSVAARVSWTVTFTNLAVGSVSQNNDGGLETSHDTPGFPGPYIATFLIGTSQGDTITPDAAADGWQRGAATTGQTYTTWTDDAPSGMTVTWQNLAHTVALSADLLQAKTGSGAASVAVAASATGSSVSNATGSGAASVAVSTSATGTAARFGTAATTISVSASATGQRTRFGVGTAAVAIATSATGSATGEQTSAGSTTVTVSATATGQRTRFGVGTAAATVAVAATGTPTRFGSGATPVAVATSADGTPTRFGFGAATVTVSTSATGNLEGNKSGSAATAVTIAATATPTHVKRSTAAATIAVATSATGSANGTKTGSGAASVAVSTSATGTATRFGTASTLVSVITSADGTPTRFGTAATSVAVAASATGAIVLPYTTATNPDGYHVGAPQRTYRTGAPFLTYRTEPAGVC